MKKSINMRRILSNLFIAALIASPFLYIGSVYPATRHTALFTILLGYLSLILVFVSLLIGPLNLLRSRRNPVNIFLRRDIGIWSAVTGCYHVALAVETRSGSQILRFFLREGSIVPLFTLYGLSNDTGLFATILLVLLLLLSNTLSLRLLKGKRWKQIQRLSYLLTLLALAHTFGYQYIDGQNALFFVAVISMIVLVLIGQGIGIALVRARQKRG
ncbi:MAG TPA: ferric reductase-like transmembrane domain-containing protein [Ktedonobacteraceae bacterium]|nr:ferric reductase-like transmembrane domain-containing protein [Ktedonobacteraceae bacterium]